MIKKNSFTKEWIDQFANDNEERTKVIERVIHALYLLEEISKFNIDFTFKGGTSLMMMTQEFKRFSTDIDILVDEGNIESFCLKVLAIKKGVFTEVEEDYRKDIGIKKRHFLFTYTSHYDAEKPFVILDIVYEENPYLSFQDTPISFELIDVEDKISKVKTPILEELLSDKMTAFAPKTIGITYDSGKKIEIIKQLFDISTIYNRLGIDDHTIDMYYEIAKHELKCRKMIEETTPLDCINDSIEASELILSNGTHWNITDFSYLRTGVNGFKHYLNGSFNINDAFRLAADAYIMYVVTKSESIKNFDDLMLKSEDVNIDDTFLKGNKRFLSRHLENFNDLLKTIAVNNLLNENDK